MNPQIIDIVGNKYGRLTVLGFAFSKEKKPRWNCVCECGVELIAIGVNLKSGNTNSCGCYNIDRIKSANSTHGMVNTPEYKSWSHMRQRCNNPRNHKYPDYGGRGITVCKRWDSFEMFLSDMGKKPGRAYTIERKNNNGNYEPINCVWATNTDQANNRRSSVFVTLGGSTMTVAQWAKHFGVSPQMVHKRMSVGVIGERLFAPSRLNK